MARDGRRCVITGYVDTNERIQNFDDFPMGTKTMISECVHIVPEHINGFNGADAEAKVCLTLHRELVAN
jgi:hypothetical protein